MKIKDHFHLPETTRSRNSIIETSRKHRDGSAFTHERNFRLVSNFSRLERRKLIIFIASPSSIKGRKCRNSVMHELNLPEVLNLRGKVGWKNENLKLLQVDGVENEKLKGKVFVPASLCIHVQRNAWMKKLGSDVDMEINSQWKSICKVC